jgi:hypothetical protein
MSRKLQPIFSGPDGAVIQHTGRYAREAVLTAFNMIGGVDRLADWADKNPGEFFTKLMPKVITREVDIGTGEGVEELLRQLDAKTIDITPEEM